MRLLCGGRFCSRTAKMAKQSATRLTLAAARAGDHARAVFAGRLAEPAIGGAEERALVGIADQIGDLRTAQPRIGEVMLHELAPGFVDELAERGALAGETALEGVIAHAQRG